VYERTTLSNQTLQQSLPQLPQNFFKDPYIFEFLELPDGHSEKDLEKALILNLQKFILEIGKGFTYMGNQYRLQVGNKDYFTDLLFYHRDLQCLVLFELKIQEFEPEFLGKLNFYLEALDRKDTEVVEYAMARNNSPAIIADYETKLIPKSVLANKLHQLVEQLTKDEIE
jgi:predicted nuclease of restriction endonuclease-like (RecB) superfamily